MSACIIARHRAIGRPGVGGVAGRQGGGLSEGQAGSGRQAAQRTPPPREGAYLFLAIAVFVFSSFEMSISKEMSRIYMYS